MMLTEIAPNVYWFDGQASNVYLCVDEDGLTLIDSCMPKREKMIWAALAEIGHQPSELRRILITHADLDHAGSAAALQAQSGATVYAGTASAAFLGRGKLPKHMLALMQFITDHFIKYQPISANVIQTIEEGDVLPILGGLQVMATPGHTSDHLSFYNPTTGVLFVGDALNTRNGRLQSTPERMTADQEVARRSAIRLLELAPAIFACGHGRPMNYQHADNLAALLNELRS